ncbi:MAG: hypothetical protein ABI616_00530 [Pseudomonadota bacterium]
MNAIKIRTTLFCLLVAGLATSVASAMDGAAVEKHREEKQERQAQHQQRQAPQAKPQGQPPQASSGAQHAPGNSGNGNHLVIGPPRGPQSPNYHGPGSNIVPPPRYANQPGHGSQGHGYPPGYYHPPHYVPALPVGYHSHYWNGNPYYYGGGHWYRPYGSSFVVVGAPYGLFVSSLPYYSSFWYGNARYFYSDGVYYNYAPAQNGYVVAPSPYANENEHQEGATPAVDNMYVYPAQGQSEQQQADDKYQCHRWAVDQSGYDPTTADFDAQRRADYDRAITACLTGRGYTVS